MKKLIILILLLFSSLYLYCGNLFNKEIENYFKILEQAYKENDGPTYYQTIMKIAKYPDSLEARKAIEYYFFDFQYSIDNYLFPLQSYIKRLGFHEDWDVLDRFYKRYQERYSCEAVRKDSSLVSVHQAYIQFLAVCNYEKIKPLYLQELCETILEGDYTYAFNSYLLPEHWQEVADTLMKYYWSVKDKDTRMRMNEAILKLKGNKGKDHYISIIQKEPYEISRTFFMQFESDTTMLKEYLPYVQDAKLKFILGKYLSLRRKFAKEKK